MASKFLNISTDITLGGNAPSDTIVASEKVIKTYVDTDLNGKVDKSSLSEVYPVVETYSSGTSWYRVYSDGWCEQGGFVTGGVSWGVVTVNLLKTMSNTNYSVDKKWVCSSAITNASYDATGAIYNRSNMTTSSFQTFNGAWDGFYWQASGYIS